MRKRYFIEVCICILICVIILTVIWACVDGHVLKKSQNEEIEKTATEQVIFNNIPEIYYVYENLERLQVLSEKKWEEGSFKEKYEALECVIEIEGVLYGIDDPVSICFSNLKHKELARYETTKQVIKLNYRYLMLSPRDEWLSAVLHEFRHHYQYNLVLAIDTMDPKYTHLKFLEPILDFKEEFLNYVSPDDNIEAYMTQEIEKDAANYASVRTEYYLRNIDDICDANDVEEEGKE